PRGIWGAGGRRRGAARGTEAAGVSHGGRPRPTGRRTGHDASLRAVVARARAARLVLTVGARQERGERAGVGPCPAFFPRRPARSGPASGTLDEEADGHRRPVRPTRQGAT